MVNLFLGPFQIVMVLLVMCLFLLPFFALIDIVKSQFKGNDKIVWVLLVLFLPILGSILYFAIGKSQKIG